MIVTNFLARWKAKAAQVIDLSPEKEQVRIMMRTFCCATSLAFHCRESVS
jgi:hypothetical protein